MTQFCLLGIVKPDSAQSAVSAINAHSSVKNARQIETEYYSLIMAVPADAGFSTRAHFELIEFLSQSTVFVPFYGAQFASAQVARNFLLAHKSQLDTQYMRCAARRQITLSMLNSSRPPLLRPRISGLRRKSELFKLVEAARLGPVKLLRETKLGGSLLHLLYQNSLADRAYQELISASANRTGIKIQISKPMSPVQFEGLKISFLSSRQITAAELLMDIATDAPIEEIRSAVTQQLQFGLQNPRFLLDDVLLRQRSRAGALLNRVANARAALLDAGVKCSLLEIPFIRSQNVPIFGAPSLAERDMLHSKVA